MVCDSSLVLRLKIFVCTFLVLLSANIWLSQLNVPTARSPIMEYSQKRRSPLSIQVADGVHT